MSEDIIDSVISKLAVAVKAEIAPPKKVKDRANMGKETKWRLIAVDKRSGIYHRLVAEGTEKLGENEELILKLPDTTITLVARR